MEEGRRREEEEEEERGEEEEEAREEEEQEGGREEGKAALAAAERREQEVGPYAPYPSALRDVRYGATDLLRRVRWCAERRPVLYCAVSGSTRRMRYAMSGIVLRARYAMSSTDLGYVPTRWLRDVRLCWYQAEGVREELSTYLEELRSSPLSAYARAVRCPVLVSVYAVCDTEAAYGAISLRACCAMCTTVTAFAAIGLRGVRGTGIVYAAV
eukprot:2671161-Rhodomonas_salina.1